MSDRFDLGHPRRIHVLNAGGAGMSALATVLAEMGHRVTGSDANETVFIEPLRQMSVEVEVSSSRTPLDPAIEALAVSTATPLDHPDVIEASRRGVPVLTRADLLGVISTHRTSLVVSGTHGKTTTSAMLASALDHAGTDPSYLVGARVTSLGRNAAWRSGDLFVVEGDESDATFLGLQTSIGVVTNIEPDHLEFWGSFDGLIAGFEQFVDQADHALVCADDPVAADIARRLGAMTYGTDDAADFRVHSPRTDRLDSTATVTHPGGDVEIRLTGSPGMHNLRNATATLGCGLLAGVDADAMAAGLASYRGVARRFEPRGQAAGVTFVDSYDHLPTEVRSALAAARLGDWPRVVCVFQPHRFSRTEALAAEFGEVFSDADLVVLTEIYSAGEAPRPGITGRLLVDAVASADPTRDVRWQPSLDDVTAFLVSELRPGDLCLTLGAGDLTTVPSRVMEALEQGSSR